MSQLVSRPQLALGLYAPRLGAIGLGLLCLGALWGCHASTVKPVLTEQPIFARESSPGDDAPYGAWHRITEGRIGEDLFPVSRADGSVVFSSNRHSNRYKLYLREDPESPVVRQLTQGTGDDLYPAVAPDGERIAFASNRSGDWRLYLAKTPDDASPSRLTEDETTEIHPTWTPDGTAVVYSRLSPVTGQWEIWIRPVLGPPRRITEGLFPHVHPDGNTIVFQRPRQRGDRWYSIWTVRLDGTRETEIATGRDHGVTNPSWSPDGRWIVYNTVGRSVALGDQGNDLYVIGADGLHERRLTFSSSPEWNPHWGPDGWIYFCATSNTETAVWRIRPPTE